MTAVPPMPPVPPARSPWREAWARLRKDRLALACAASLALLGLACALGPPLAGAFGVDATTIDTLLGATPPSRAHWLGTDTLGRDLLVRILIGGRVALTVGALATAIAVLIGVAYGAIAGYAGGRLDELLMRLVDALYGLPTVVLVIVVMAATGARSLLALIGLVGAISWLTMARITRGQVLLLKHREFALAARAAGASPSRVLLRHLLPNAAGPVIVYATLALPQVMLVEALLSFLGLGVQAPLASWGTLVTEGGSQLVVYPWLLVGPSAVMAVTVLALNFLGDGLRDALDPQAPPRRD
ncbi:MAG TPA: ABC transporter permease [Kofleriaceae bacterium]|nr:ABC transporter permease [Kofleriaceae bacterium]